MKVSYYYIQYAKGLLIFCVCVCDAGWAIFYAVSYTHLLEFLLTYIYALDQSYAAFEFMGMHIYI